MWREWRGGKGDKPGGLVRQLSQYTGGMVVAGLERQHWQKWEAAGFR